MDTNQYNLILSAVSISANPHLVPDPATKQKAFTLLSQFKSSDNAAVSAFQLLDHPHPHQYNGLDVTPHMKLYALQCLLSSISQHYSKQPESARQHFKNKILEQIATTTETDKLIHPKLASLLADLTLRDFPQRWPTFFADVQQLLSLGDTPTLIVLSALTLTVEDCTDSDFNTKVSTSRRNDVLQGLNELAPTLLPAIFNVAQTQYNKLLANKADPAPLKQLTELLSLLHTFCIWMPVEWADSPTHDFISVFLHLLRESTGNLNVKAATCLDALCGRRTDNNLYARLIVDLPKSIAEANACNPTDDLVKLTLALDFHRTVSSSLAHLLQANIHKITDDKSIVAPKISQPSQSLTNLKTYLQLMCEMLQHPCPIIASIQINTWVSLSRDPQIAKSGLLRPLLPHVFLQCLAASKKVDWEHVESGEHPLADLYEEAWCDCDDYESWANDFRGKLGMLVKIMSAMDPNAASTFLSERLDETLATYGYSPGDDATTITELESLSLFMDNVLQGCCAMATNLPSVAVQNLGKVATQVVAWNPVTLKTLTRKCAWTESLRHFWVHDTQTNSLPGAVEAMFVLLSARDDPASTAPILNQEQLSPDTVLLRRKAGSALVGIGKSCDAKLVSYVGQLAERSSQLMNANVLLPNQKQHLIEFLTCVASAVDDVQQKTSFVSSMVGESLNYLTSPEFTSLVASADSLLSQLGITNATPQSVVDVGTVNSTSTVYSKLFSALNQLLSVGKRCHESKGNNKLYTKAGAAEMQRLEGPVRIAELAQHDPFVHNYPNLVQPILTILSLALQISYPAYRAVLLPNPVARYALSVSDEEAVVGSKKFSAGTNPMTEVEQHGFVIKGTNRKKCNLAPRWSGWLNELRNSPFQMLGLMCSTRAMWSPEVQPMYQHIVNVFSIDNLKSMEHRQIVQLIKQFVESFLLHCPSQLYATHLTPILAPILAHLQHRLAASWTVFPGGKVGTPAVDNNTVQSAASECSSTAGSDAWFNKFYSYSGLFVGDLDSMDSEALVDKTRIDLTHTWADCVMAALALRGEWALTLANIAKEFDTAKRGGNAKPVVNSKHIANANVNADGTVRDGNSAISEARNVVRIDALASYLLTTDAVAGPVVMTTIACLSYPDAHTCRRAIKISHRILETCASEVKYEAIFAQMFEACIKNILMEQRWMAGCEWDLIALVRDIYCRLVMGQSLTPAGQGPGLQCACEVGIFQQPKSYGKPREGGGVLAKPSDAPRQLLSSCPGKSPLLVMEFEKQLNAKRSAKDQKNTFRDFLLVSSELIKKNEGAGVDNGVFGRKDAGEQSVLQRQTKSDIEQNPEGAQGVSASARKRAKAKMKKDKASWTAEQSLDGAANLFDGDL